MLSLTCMTKVGGMKVYRNQSPKGNTDFYEYSFQGGLRLNVPGDWKFTNAGA